MRSRSARMGMKGVAALGMVLASMVVVLAGCGGAKPANTAVGLTEDQKEIQGLVSGFADYSSSLARMKAKFVKASAPKAADVKKYANCSFSALADQITVSGESATATVEIIKTDPNTGTPSAPATQSWKFAKEDGEWKIVEAPV